MRGLRGRRRSRHHPGSRGRFLPALSASGSWVLERIPSLPCGWVKLSPSRSSRIPALTECRLRQGASRQGRERRAGPPRRAVCHRRARRSPRPGPGSRRHAAQTELDGCRDHSRCERAHAARGLRRRGGCAVPAPRAGARKAGTGCRGGLEAGRGEVLVGVGTRRLAHECLDRLRAEWRRPQPLRPARSRAPPAGSAPPGRARGHRHEQRKPADALCQEGEELERGLVSPLDVVDGHAIGRSA